MKFEYFITSNGIFFYLKKTEVKIVFKKNNIYIIKILLDLK